MAAQSPGREAREVSREYSACRVFQPRHLRVQLVEAGERGVEVRLVEDFAAVDPVVFDGQK